MRKGSIMGQHLRFLRQEGLSSKQEIKHTMGEKVARREAKDNPTVVDKSHGSRPPKGICSAVSELKVGTRAFSVCFLCKD